MDFADASLVVLAEDVGTNLVHEAKGQEVNWRQSGVVVNSPNEARPHF